ncbi:MAG: glycerol-3-phosphate 1-O-acyltransferase PlsY [Spirochaetales bacterium]|nr:glycerol-3-phosphate 1-O-acyltransferase PlsY [Spirochaetales bacterium]
MKIVLIALIGYLTGSISFAVIIGYLAKGIDIRKMGSGNAGATNVKRILGFKLGATVMILDFLKGLLPILLINNFQLPINLELVKIILLLSLILGHLYPIWFSFKGGKGVATAAGGITAIFPPAFPFSIVVFILSRYIGKHVSLASLISAWILPVFYYIFTNITKTDTSVILLIFFIFIAILITISHRKNIVRLYKGTEY